MNLHVINPSCKIPLCHVTYIVSGSGDQDVDVFVAVILPTQALLFASWLLARA